MGASDTQGGGTQAEALDANLTVMDTLVRAAPDAQLNDVKALLGRMMFTGRSVQKKARPARQLVVWDRMRALCKVVSCVPDHVFMWKLHVSCASIVPSASSAHAASVGINSLHCHVGSPGRHQDGATTHPGLTFGMRAPGA